MEGKVEIIFRDIDILDDESLKMFLYRLKNRFNIEELTSGKVKKKFNFKGMNYFDVKILDRDFYSFSEEELVDYITNKSTDYMFRTKEEILKVAYGDGASDTEIEHEIEAEVKIHRRYSNCIVTYEIKEV